MKSLKDIITEHSTEAEFPFLGGSIVVSKERNVYNQLRQKYNEIADKAQSDFTKRISQYSDPNSFFKGVTTDFLYALKDGFDELTKDAISVDCYTLDMDAAAKLCTTKGYFDAYDKALNEYKNAYTAILAKHLGSVSDAYSDAENHPNLQVATIGGSLGDVFMNQMKADMTNAVIGELYSMAAAETVSDILDKSDKEIAQFFSDPTYKDNIINSVWSCAANLRLVISNHLSKEYDLGLGGWITDDDSSKAESMHNNLSSIQLPEDKAKELAASIIQLNPYNYNYYKTLLTKYLDNSREILAVAEFFGINLSGSIKSIMEGFAKNNLGSSFDDVKQCRELVNAKISELGFPDGSDELAEDTIQKHIALLIKKYMAENMGGTRESALKCFGEAYEIGEDIGFDEEYFYIAYEEFDKKMEVFDAQLVEELTSWVNENIGTTEDDAHKCRDELDKKITEHELDPEKAAAIFKTIDDRLAKLDEEYRTVEGFTFPTRESADETKAIINDNKNILYRSPSEFTFRSDYTAHIERIKAVPLIEKLIVHFTGIYENHLKEFDKKCKNAKLHDDKLKGQKKSLKSLARSMFVSDEKQQQDWNEVTHNGQYTLNEIMGITDEENCNTSGGGLKGLFGKK